jgi:hypothetical protein
MSETYVFPRAFARGDAQREPDVQGSSQDPPASDLNLVGVIAIDNIKFSERKAITLRVSKLIGHPGSLLILERCTVLI